MSKTAANTTTTSETAAGTAAAAVDIENQAEEEIEIPGEAAEPSGALVHEEKEENENGTGNVKGAPQVVGGAAEDDDDDDDEKPGVAERISDEENPHDTDDYDDEEPTDPSLRFPFPKAFYDPISNKIMVEPVVLPDGNSYEKEDVIERGSGEIFYPNRALKAYIEAELDRFGDAGTVRAAVQQWSESLRTGWQRLVDGSSVSEERPLPTAFYGPITFELLQEPVIDPDGHSYEKAAIYQWIQANGDSPVTRKPLSIDQLYDNNALLNVLLELSDESNPQSVYPSMRKWKEDHDNHTPTPLPDPTAPPPDNSQHNVNGPDSSTSQNHHYPTTRAELEALQRLRNQKNATLLGIMIVCLLIFFFAPSYFMCFLMILVAASIVYAPQMARHRQLEERRREIIAEAYRQQQRHQARQQQQQQQQQQRAY